MGDHGTETVQHGAPPRVDAVELLTHELLTPISVVSGAVDVLIQHADRLDAVQRDTLHRAIRRHAVLMASLVRRLAALRELQWGRLDLDLEPVDLVALARELVQDVSTLTGATAPAMEVVASGPVLVEADRPAIEEIVVILLSNAIEHGEGTRIRVTAGTGDGSAWLRIRDHGPGITRGERARVFEPYVRGTTRGPGTGIGLTLGRGLAVAHGGDLRLRPSPAGGGSLFELTLPLPTI